MCSEITNRPCPWNGAVAKVTSHAVISTDLDPRYAWYLPLTCLAWREVCGCTPLALLVGERAEWMR